MSRLWITLGLAAMEACWSYAWAALFGAWTGQAGALVSAFGVAMLLGVGALASLAFGKPAARTRSGRLAVAGAGLLIALLVLRGDYYTTASGLDWLADLARALAAAIGQPSSPVLALAFALFLWWRGVRIGIRTPTYIDVESAFKWGIGRLVVFGLLIPIGVQPSRQLAIETATTPSVVGFFFVSLLTLALGRLESLRTRSRALALNSQWLGVLIAVSGCIVLLALVLGQLLSFDLLVLAAQPLFDVLGRVLVAVVYVIVLPLAYLVEWLIYLVLSLLQGTPLDQPPQPLQPSDLNDMLQRLFAQQLPPELVFALKLGVAIALVAAGLVFVARVAARWRPTRPDVDAAEEERDSLWEPGRLRRALMAWLRALLRRRGRPAAGGAATGPARTTLIAAEGGLSDVRALYRRLLAQGEAAGARRAAATTPLEHMPALEHALEPSASIADLTDAYVRTRYAEVELSAAVTAELRADLAQVHPRDHGAS